MTLVGFPLISVSISATQWAEHLGVYHRLKAMAAASNSFPRAGAAENLASPLRAGATSKVVRFLTRAELFLAEHG
jgi:hypothetical protein